MTSAWVKDATPLRCLLCDVLGISVYADEKVPEDELWIMSDLDQVEPMAKITGIKMDEDRQGLSYDMKLKKPLERIYLELTPDKAKDNKNE